MELKSNFTEGIPIGPCKTREDVALLCKNNGYNKRGAELGVGKGKYTFKICNYFEEFWAIDWWELEAKEPPYYKARHLDTEYEKVKRISKNSDIITKFNVIREKFDNAVHEFEDNFFDFIHIDGYAKNKEQLIRNLKNWYPKVKPGGIFSGHDMQYPRVEQIIRQFAEEKKLTLNITGEKWYNPTAEKPKRLSTNGPAWWFQL